MLVGRNVRAHAQVGRPVRGGTPPILPTDAVAIACSAVACGELNSGENGGSVPCDHHCSAPDVARHVHSMHVLEAQCMGKRRM